MHHDSSTSSPRRIGNGIGGSIDDAADDGCLCHGDVAWIDVDTYASETPRDEFLAASASDIRNVRDVPSDSDYRQQVGYVICRGGATSLYVCGSIDRTIASRIGNPNIDGHDVDMLHRTNFDASGGDSGAVMFVGPDFQGVHNDSLDGVDPPENGHSWYSSGTRIEALGNDVCQTSAC